MSLLAGLLRGSHTELQAAAAAVLHEVACKRMEPAAKLAMLQVTRVPGTACAVLQPKQPWMPISVCCATCPIGGL